MASKVQICNLALTRMVADRITSLADGTKSAIDCDAIFDLIAEETIAKGAWPSCLFRTSLAQLDETPAFGYGYAYQLPSDPKFLAALALNECKIGEIDFALESGKLLTNEASVSIRYVGYVLDPETYDIFLRQAIVDRLVAELVYSKTGSLSAYKAALEAHEAKARQLLAQSGTQQHSTVINSDTFIDARNGAWSDEGRLRD